MRVRCERQLLGIAGGWCICSVESHDALCRDLAKQANIVVVSLDYRLAPEHKFPAGLEDCYAAVQWISHNAEELNINPAKLALGGDSAGGNLTAATLLLSQQRGGVPIAFQLLLYPSVAVMETESRKQFAKGYALDKTLKTWFFTSYVSNPQQDAKNPLVSPYFAESLEAMPPAHVLTAGCDPLRDEGKLYAERLKQEGVAVTHKNYDGMLHGFLNHMYMLPLDIGDEAVKDCAMHLRQALHGSNNGKL